MFTNKVLLEHVGGGMAKKNIKHIFSALFQRKSPTPNLQPGGWKLYAYDMFLKGSGVPRVPIVLYDL